MIKIVSVEGMRAIEAAADSAGTTYDTMFERVATAVTGRINSLLMSVPEPRVAILVGAGNNGGDGLVTAVKLAEQGEVEVGVYLVTARDKNDEKLAAVREAGVFVAEAENDKQYRVLRNLVGNAHIVIDAIFGIGVRLPLEGEIVKILSNAQQALNAPLPPPPEGTLITPDSITDIPHWQRPLVLALDCPSGVNCDTGEIDKNTLKADETITFIAVKKGLIASPAVEYVGTLHVATLGIPEDLDEFKAETLIMADASAVADMLPERPIVSNKGTYGKIMIVAGSLNYTGAAGLSALAAYRTGAGLVTVCAPMPVISGLASQMLEVTWILLPHDMGVISENATDVITKEMKPYSAMLIGPGLAQEDTTGDMLTALLEQSQEQPKPREKRSIGFAAAKKSDLDDNNETDDDAPAKLPPLVLDADALNLLSKVENWWEKVPENTIITPHPGEMSRLCGKEIAEVMEDRIGLAQEKSAEWKTIVLLKGAYTVIAAPDGRTAVLPFKTSALATAGTGDVLAGIIVSLLAQGADPFDAAVAGGYIHGSAGIMAEQLVGSPHGVIAGDVLDLIGDIIGELT